MSARAWALNIDVERELATPDATLGPPNRAVRAAVAMARERLRGTLVRADDVVLGEGRDEEARGLPGLAWCPTPSALTALRAAGAVPVEAPPLEALQAVNAKPFGARLAAELEQPLEKLVVGSLDEALSALKRTDHSDWLVRRPFGAAGRARRKIRAASVSAEDRTWLEVSISHGELVVEPWVEPLTEFALHGQVENGRLVATGVICVQAVDANGLWNGTRPANDGETAPEEREAVRTALECAAERAGRAGYFGPLGIDALRFCENGAVRFQALNDLNARYSMGWAIGMQGSKLR